jgi:hypothetical protein
MVSAFQSRELGFAPNLSKDELERVNTARRGKNYVDSDAAKELSPNNSAAKQDLKESPLIKYFHAGQNNDGYWCYSHMVIQLEDVFDCCGTLWPEFEHDVLFDSSSGHKKKCVDGLDADKMNAGFGGVQPQMRNSIMIEIDGFFGSFERILNVGDTQIFVFRSSDEGPFWMSGPATRDHSG